MVVGDDVVRILAQLLAAADVGVDRTADDRTRPDDRDLDREVAQVPGPHPPQHLDLRATFDLKEAHRVSRTDAVVDLLVLVVDAGEVGGLAVARVDRLHRLLDERQHPEREEIDLDEPRVVAGVLVPLAEDAPLPRGGLEGDDLHQRSARDDHPAHVLGDVPRESPDLLGQFGEGPPDPRVRARLETGDALQFGHEPVLSGFGEFGQFFHVAGREAERLAQFARDRARAVGGEGAHEPDVVVSVALVDREDQFLPDIARKVYVDVRDALHGVVQEPAEKEVRPHRIHVGEPDQITDDGGDRGSATAAGGEQLARHRVAPHAVGDLPGEFEDVVIDEEEPGQVVAVDEREFGGEPFLGFAAVSAAGGIADLERPAADLVEYAHGGGEAAPLEVGEAVAEIGRKIERPAALGDHARVAERVGPRCEAPRHLPGRGEVKAGVGAAEFVRIVDRRPVPDRDQDVLETVPVGDVVVDVARGHDRDAEPVGQRAQRPAAREIAVDRVVLEFDEEAAGTEGVAQPARESLGFVRPPFERREEGTPAAPGEEDEPFGPFEERVEVEPGLPARALHVRPGDEPAQVRVPRRALRQHRDVAVGRFRRPSHGNVSGGGERRGEGEFGARDRLESVGAGELRELHRAVEPVVIGERERGIAQFERARRQFLGPRRPIEKRVGGVRVQLDVVDGGHGLLRLQEPAIQHQIVVRGEVGTVFEDDREVGARDRFPPPLVIDPPLVEHAADATPAAPDLKAHGHSGAAEPDPHRTRTVERPQLPRGRLRPPRSRSHAGFRHGSPASATAATRFQ